MKLDGFFIDNEQWATLDKLGRDLTWWPGNSDAMRDTANKLWQLIHVISEQRISARVTAVEEDDDDKVH